MQLLTPDVRNPFQEQSSLKPWRHCFSLLITQRSVLYEAARINKGQSFGVSECPSLELVVISLESTYSISLILLSNVVTTATQFRVLDSYLSDEERAGILAPARPGALR